MQVRDVVISSAARTAVGSFGRSLRDLSPTELGAFTARAAIERARLDPAQVEQVVFGNVIDTAPEDHYLASAAAKGIAMLIERD
jgi:acetyl-CoA C-acetyltransferase